ncbi:L,D-transpeptidase family protein [Rhodalgimonas zhirmunskyi]|uniref:L,D-transpeptidase family protein n=1 Tax=Rhodalgimonas zhirmunskyi TaxID=2964767 RepID=A0AAJ1X4E8_9RHOB|nr:L,D-transpeptidase family protein [Rhodoalgimonas zhirmunskyi]MDQ2094193.1 L,D-transpeptidase family protein [Rhodoalgimonas zhirmunskyi]
MTPDDLVLTPVGLRFAGRVFPCSIGKGGIRADKREGDGATPTGTHRIVGVFYRPDRVAPPVSWAEAVGPNDLWSDASGEAGYNSHVRAPYAYSHERLRRGDPLYDIVLVMDWNWPHAQAGRGSAIFLHQWRRPGYPTEGCIAFSRADLAWIARRIVPGTRVIVPQTLAG